VLRAVGLLACFLPPPAVASNQDDVQSVPILVYHRFGPSVVDRMTVTTPVFESHLRHLREKGYTVIPLRRLLAACSPPGAVRRHGFPPAPW